MSDSVRVGILGYGVVGTATARILSKHATEIETRTGAPIEITRVAVGDVTLDRGLDLDRSSLTDDPWEVVRDPAIDVVVEVMGGIDPARALILEAISNKK